MPIENKDIVAQCVFNFAIATRQKNKTKKHCCYIILCSHCYGFCGQTFVLNNVLFSFLSFKLCLHSVHPPATQHDTGGMKENKVTLRLRKGHDANALHRAIRWRLTTGATSIMSRQFLTAPTTISHH